MTPEKKLAQLKLMFFPLDNPIFNKMTGEQLVIIRDANVMMFIDEMIRDRKRYPKDFWEKVKLENEKQNK